MNDVEVAAASKWPTEGQSGLVPASNGESPTNEGWRNWLMGSDRLRVDDDLEEETAPENG